MEIKNKGGYVVPVAIGILVVASLGLMMSSWWGGSQKINLSEKKARENASSTLAQTVLKQSTANDDATLDVDSANIDAQIKALDGSNSDVGASLNDSSSI